MLLLASDVSIPLRVRKRMPIAAKPFALLNVIALVAQTPLFTLHATIPVSQMRLKIAQTLLKECGVPLKRNNLKAQKNRLYFDFG